jgi:hypothetical protein
MKVLVHDGHDWVQKYWSARGMSEHESVGPHKGMCDISSAGTLTCIKSLETVCMSAFATVFERFAIADRFFIFW